MDFEKEIKELKEVLNNKKPRSMAEMFPGIIVYTVTAILIILKALGLITLPWIWITVFLWLPFAFIAFFICAGLVIMIGAFILFGVATFFDFISEKNNTKGRK